MDIYEFIILLVIFIGALVGIYNIYSQRIKKLEENLNRNIEQLNKEIASLTNSTYKLATDTTLKTYNPWDRRSGVKTTYDS